MAKLLQLWDVHAGDSSVRQHKQQQRWSPFPTAMARWAYMYAITRNPHNVPITLRTIKAESDTFFFCVSNKIRILGMNENGCDACFFFVILLFPPEWSLAELLTFAFVGLPFAVFSNYVILVAVVVCQNDGAYNTYENGLLCQQFTRTREKNDIFLN